MKRLLKISLDIFITSFTAIVSWFVIGLVIDKNLTNVFSLTYPLQCIGGIIISIFGVGANVCEYKDKNKNASDNGIFYGIILAFIIFGLFFCNCSKYISFMNMDANIYLVFCRYSILQLLLQVILQLVVNKFYYIEDNSKANKIVILFNMINLIVLTIVAIITKNQIIVSTVTLLVLSIFNIIVIIKNVHKVDFKLNIKNCFKYDSVSCVSSILFFIMYLFGFSNSFAFGEKYVIAITFATLVTDIQWDICAAIKTVAKIDIVKEKFEYEYHLKNAKKLIYILIISIIIMIMAMYPIYKPNIFIVSIFILLHIIDFLMTPYTNIKTPYLEIKDSNVKVTTNTTIAFILRTIICLAPTPFCTIIGQMCSSLLEFAFANMRYYFVKAKESIHEK